MSRRELPTEVLDTGLFTTDHRVLGRRFVWAGLWFLLLGGLLAMAIRWQWAWPGRPLPLGKVFLPGSEGAITPAAYTGLFTMHGLVMIFFAITPMLIQGLGTALLPLQLGARALAFPRMSAIAFWLLLLCAGARARLVRAARSAPPRPGGPSTRRWRRRSARPETGRRWW